MRHSRDRRVVRPALAERVVGGLLLRVRHVWQALHLVLLLLCGTAVLDGHVARVNLVVVRKEGFEAAQLGNLLFVVRGVDLSGYSATLDVKVELLGI